MMGLFGDQMLRASMAIREKAMVGMGVGIELWMEEQDVLLGQDGEAEEVLLSLRHDQFEAARRDLVHHGKAEMHRALQYAQDLGIGRTYLDENYGVGVVLAEDEGNRYRRVWLKEDDPEYQKDKSNPTALRKLWRKRLTRAG